MDSTQENKYSVKLKTIVEKAQLDVIHLSQDYEEVRLHTPNVNRPGLQMTGFYDFFDADRIQIIGKMETAFLEGLSEADRKNRFEALMSRKIPALVISHGVKIFPECVEMAKKYDVSIFSTDGITSEEFTRILGLVQESLAPRITRHGVLVEVYGEGLFIVGESGVGKSETAVELIKRGHRLIADDAVELKRVDSHTVIGTAPELIRYYIELRGIGVIDVRRIFGSSAYKRSENIDLVVEVEPWRENVVYDRLGVSDNYTDILGVKIPSITIPINPGRNLAIILEVAAMNNRQKKMGYNSAQEFMEQTNRFFSGEMALEDE